MTMKQILLLLLITTTDLCAQIKQNSVLLMNATAHIGNGDVINHSLVGIKNGKIILVANALTTTPDKSQYDSVINLEGKHIYPGMIAADVSIGLVEVEAVRATADQEETGNFNPNARALVAFNTDSKIIPTVRANGVLMAQTTPRGGILSGASSVMKLSAWNWEDAVIRTDDGLHLNWPASVSHRRWWMETQDHEPENHYVRNVSEIEGFFKSAKAYYEEKDHPLIDVRFEAMRGLFDGSKTLYVHCNYVKEITGAVNFCRDLKISRLVIVGGYESWMVTDMLKENKVAVILRRLHELPLRAEDDIDLPFKIPALLQKAGVLFCLGNAGDQEAAQSRNIPFLAGTAAAYGLTKEEALMSVTLNAAKILGIDKSVGSLEVGKDATLFVSLGDALDMRTNNVVGIYIQGQPVNPKTFQYDLFKKYEQKYMIGK